MGGRLLERLLADPDVREVRSVARRDLPERPRLRHVRADLREAAARRALEGADVLFHLGFQLWRTRGEDAGCLNLDSTLNVTAARPGHVVFASSAAVYGAWADNPLPLREEHQTRPNRECAYAAHKLASEEACRSAAPTTVLRISAVVGPGADPAVREAIRLYRRAVPAVRGARQALQFLDEDDAARALVAAGSQRPEGTYNVATADWLDERQLAELAGSRVLRLPRRLTMLGAELGYRLGLAPAGRDRAIFLTGPLALSIDRARADLAWEPRLDSRSALRRLLS